MPLYVLQELHCYDFGARHSRAFTTLSILIHVAPSNSYAVFRPTTPLFWVSDLGNFKFLNAKEFAKEYRQWLISPKSNSTACVELLCMNDFKLFRIKVFCFNFPLYPS